ncbi:MAG: hypothetical protein EPO21_14955 [Chloroflexota bacterium]|nr:MAG: hypothetical protein EPO21_14955 [Chloroflexota bacterium]
MRGRRGLVGGIAALVVGIIGLLTVVPAIGASLGPNGWGPGPWGMMGMPAMAGMMGGPVAADAQPIDIERASTVAQNYIASLGNPNLALAEVMEFGGNYYVQALERDTGVRAFELLIDKYTAAVFPEMGPNMLWNTRYGMMGGMMGWRRSAQGQSAEMSIGPERAQELARQYLKTQGLPLDVAQPDRFYGYYTMHTLRQDGIEGMLSVNGYSGQVWYHVWHGPFVQERELMR